MVADPTKSEYPSQANVNANWSCVCQKVNDRERTKGRPKIRAEILVCGTMENENNYSQALCQHITNHCRNRCSPEPVHGGHLNPREPS